MTFTLLIAPSSFKGTLSALTATQVMAETLYGGLVDIDVSFDCCPFADGGNDTLAVLNTWDSEFQMLSATVTGPLPDQTVEAHYLIHPRRHLIVIEAAQAHGILRLPNGQKNPMASTSYGVGELIRHAINTHVSGKTDWTLVITLGGSASTDGGAGALQALGYDFYDAQNQRILAPLNGALLERIHRIAFPTEFFPEEAHVLIGTDVRNPLLGESGCANVFAPQKGANANEIRYLNHQLSRWATIIKRDLGTRHEAHAGAGAAGGLGFGLSQLPGSRLVSGADWVANMMNLPERLKNSHLVITGEGYFDPTSFSGKGTGQLIQFLAQPSQLSGNHHVFVFCGQYDRTLVLPAFVHVYPLVNHDMSLDCAFREPEKALRAAVLRSLPTIRQQLIPWC